MPIILGLKRVRWEDNNPEVKLDYIHPHTQSSQKQDNKSIPSSLNIHMNYKSLRLLTPFHCSSVPNILKLYQSLIYTRHNLGIIVLFPYDRDMGLSILSSPNL